MDSSFINVSKSGDLGIGALPREAKISVVKGIRDLGVPIRQIAINTKLGCGTVQRYLKTPDNPLWAHYRYASRELYALVGWRLQMKVSKAIENKLQDGASIALSDLNHLYSVLSNQQKESPNPATNTVRKVVISVHPSLIRGYC